MGPLGSGDTIPRNWETLLTVGNGKRNKPLQGWLGSGAARQRLLWGEQFLSGIVTLSPQVQTCEVGAATGQRSRQV